MSPSASELHQMASIGRLLAGIVHEINTPIGSIFSNTEVLLRSLEMLEPLIADPHARNRSRRRARILATCRSLVGRGPDRLRADPLRDPRAEELRARRRHRTPPVDLNEQLRDTVKLTQAEFRKRIEVETRFGELPEVECYPQMLNQVFLNLLVNAGQAIEGEGKIAVRTRAGGRRGAHLDRRQRPRHDPEQKAQSIPGRLHHQAGRRRHRAGPVDCQEKSSKRSTGARSISKASRAWARRSTSASPWTRQGVPASESEWTQKPSVMIVDDEEMVITSIRAFLQLETDFDIQGFTDPEAGRAIRGGEPGGRGRLGLPDAEDERHQLLGRDQGDRSPRPAASC